MNIQNDGNKVIAGFGYALAIVSVLSALLVVLKEKNESVMLLMKTATGNHWITQGVIVLIAFGILGFLLTKYTPKSCGSCDLNRVTGTILISTVISGLILAGFNLFLA